MLEILVKLKDYAPFFSNVLWILFISLLIIIFRNKIKVFFKLMIDRIQKGSSFKAGPIEIGQELRDLDYADQTAITTQEIPNLKDREIERTKIYENNKGLFLTHIIAPSTKTDQKYDIFIYLLRHKSENFSDIDKVEFFFGHMWSNQVFTEFEKNGIIGIATSAYAPFLCTCTVIFKDKSSILINRYIDFECEKLLFQKRNS